MDPQQNQTAQPGYPPKPPEDGSIKTPQFPQPEGVLDQPPQPGIPVDQGFVVAQVEPQPQVQPAEPLAPVPFKPEVQPPVQQPESFPSPVSESEALSVSEEGVPPSLPPEPGTSGPINIKKIGLVILGLLAILIVFTLILPRISKTKQITLTYWGLWEPNSVIDGVIADFQRNNPKIKVDYVMQSAKEYRERLASAMARNQGPDIFRFHNTWVPMFKSELAPIPVKTMDAATFESRYYPVARQDLKVGNSYVGIPLEIDGLGLFINDDLFRAAGKTSPRTWIELENTAKEMTIRDEQDNIQVAGVALGRTENIDHWSDILAVMMLQNEADLANPAACTQKPAVGTQLAGEACFGADALTFFTQFSRVYRVWDETLPFSTQAFASGKLAMYFGPSWEVFTIKQANPNLNFRVVPIPQIENTNIAWASYWVEGVWKKSPQQEAAWKFLLFLSEKETMQKLYTTQSSIRLFGEPYARVDMADLIKDNDYVGAFIKQASAANSWYLSSRTFDNGLNDKIIKYYEDAVNAINSGQTAKDALMTAGPGISQVLAQYAISASVVR